MQERLLKEDNCDNHASNIRDTEIMARKLLDKMNLGLKGSYK